MAADDIRAAIDYDLSDQPCTAFDAKMQEVSANADNIVTFGTRGRFDPDQCHLGETGI
jgi:hypothetical protein